MLSRLKKNKAYYGFFASDLAYGGVITALNLSLVNLPLALIISGINLAANVVSGLLMAPGEDPSAARQAAMAAAADTPAVKLPLRKRLKSSTKSILSFYKATLRNPEFVVGTASASAGLNILFQAVLGIHSIVTAHSLLFITGMSATAATGGVAACVAAAGIGLFCMYAGNMEKWKGLGNFFADLKGVVRSAHRNSNRPSRLARYPRLEKAVNSKAGRVTKRTIMIGMSLESSFFAAAASITAIATHVGALMGNGKVASNLFSTAVAVKWLSAPVWDTFSSVKLIARDMFGKGKAVDKAKQALEDATAVMVPSLPAPKPAIQPAGALTGAFEKTATAAPAAAPVPKTPAPASISAPRV